MNILVGTLKDEREELAAFLEPRVGAKPEVTGDSLSFEDSSIRAGVKPRHVKTYIKRFLFMKDLRKKYRVFVAGSELTIQEIELGEKEEEAEEKEKAAKEKKGEAKAEEKPATKEEAAPAPAPAPEEEPEAKDAPSEKPAKPAKRAAKKPAEKTAKKEEEES